MIPMISFLSRRYAPNKIRLIFASLSASEYPKSLSNKSRTSSPSSRQHRLPDSLKCFSSILPIVVLPAPEIPISQITIPLSPPKTDLFLRPLLQQNRFRSYFILHVPQYFYTILYILSHCRLFRHLNAIYAGFINLVQRLNFPDSWDRPCLHIWQEIPSRQKTKPYR